MESSVPIDAHAHYVPPQLIDAVAARGAEIGVRLVKTDGAPPALHFEYGFKVRSFFPLPDRTRHRAHQMA